VGQVLNSIFQQAPYPAPGSRVFSNCRGKKTFPQGYIEKLAVEIMSEKQLGEFSNKP
jgi:hypothetical protein